jgi:hypothetical protein
MAESKPGNPAWVPGVSGNPSGRPKGLSRVRQLAARHTKAAIQELASIMKNGLQDKDRAHAAVALLDRAWGKPAQSIEVKGDTADADAGRQRIEALRANPVTRAALLILAEATSVTTPPVQPAIEPGSHEDHLREHLTLRAEMVAQREPTLADVLVPVSADAVLLRLYGKYRRVAVTGGPRAGKSTLVNNNTQHLDFICHTDEYMALDWSEASAKIVERVAEHRAHIVVEGVAVPRALRKGLDVGAVIWLDGAHETLTTGQRTMAKGVRTVFDEWCGGRERHPFNGGFWVVV